MRLFWRWLGLTLLGWIWTPVMDLCFSAMNLAAQSGGWLLALWVVAVPFMAYYRASVMVRHAEAREAERTAAAIAEGVRRGTRP
jgi:hypothetical protein